MEVREKELNRTIDQQSKSLKGYRGIKGSHQTLMDELTAARNELANCGGFWRSRKKSLRS
jgi:hypothetical protein